jgi:DNA-binding transcriptional regulator YiaG
MQWRFVLSFETKCHKQFSIMTDKEVRAHLEALDISRAEAAMFLSVSKRTVNRWCDGDEVPGPVEAALRAWLSLHKRGLAWKPDSISVLEADEDQIERQRKYAIRFNAMLNEVEKRGGPSTPWKVNFSNSTAKFATSEISFYKLANGGFSIGSYRRSDRHPDLAQDLPLIQDAAYCIASEYKKFGARSAALLDVANYVRANATLYVQDGPAMMTAKQRADHVRRIESLAERLSRLAQDASEGYGSYYQYEEIQRELHAAGFYPKDSLVAAVARAFI